MPLLTGNQRVQDLLGGVNLSIKRNKEANTTGVPILLKTDENHGSLMLVNSYNMASHFIKKVFVNCIFF